MKLTKIERLQLANQYKILWELTKDNSYAIKEEIVERGFEGLYEDLFESISDDISREIYEETMNILNMYDIINNSYSKLTDEQKTHINIEKLKFEGFDLNNDDHYSYMKFLVEKMGQWGDYKGKYINSHTQESIRKYRNMLNVYRNLESESIYEYTLEHLQVFQRVI